MREDKESDDMVRRKGRKAARTPFDNLKNNYNE